jgi:hypothetical protein
MKITDEHLAELRRKQAEMHAQLATETNRDAAAVLAAEHKIIEAVLAAGPAGMVALMFAQNDLLIRDALVERGVDVEASKMVTKSAWKKVKLPEQPPRPSTDLTLPSGRPL